MDYPIARKAALRLLSMRALHSSVLRRKLELKQFSEESIERVMMDCKRMGFFNDDEAILAYLRRGFGPKYIQFKLQLTRAEVRGVITRELQKKRIVEFASKMERDKAIRTLMRKGFDPDIVIEVFSTRGVE